MALSARARNHLIAIALIVVIVGVLSYVVTVATRATPTTPLSDTPVASATLHDGSVAPTNYTLPRLVGSGSVSLAALLNGRPAVINFFASWCSACAAELSAFARFNDAESNKLEVIGVDTDDHDPGAARSLLRGAHATYPVIVDTSNLTLATAYGIAAGLPVSFFVSKSGRVIGEHLGALTLAELNQERHKLLSAA